MYLMVSGALMILSHYRSNQIASHTRHPPRCISYTLQQPCKEELEHLQQQDNITLLGIDETAKWCNSFVLVSKLNGKIRLCLDPARLNQVLIRLVHGGPTQNDIFPQIK